MTQKVVSIWIQNLPDFMPSQVGNMWISKGLAVSNQLSETIHGEILAGDLRYNGKQPAWRVIVHWASISNTYSSSKSTYSLTQITPGWTCHKSCLASEWLLFLSQVLASEANLLLRFEAFSSYLLLLHLEFLGFHSQICGNLWISKWMNCRIVDFFVWQSKVQRSAQSTRRSLAQHRYCHCWSFFGIHLLSFKASETCQGCIYINLAVRVAFQFSWIKNMILVPHSVLFIPVDSWRLIVSRGLPLHYVKKL